MPPRIYLSFERRSLTSASALAGLTASACALATSRLPLLSARATFPPPFVQAASYRDGTVTEVALISMGANPTVRSQPIASAIRVSCPRVRLTRPASTFDT